MSIWRILPIQGLRKLRIVLAGLILSVFSFHPVWADDTEIYFNANRATGDTPASAKPNVLFILDASNSMLRYDCANGTSIPNWTGTDPHCGDGTPDGETTRLTRMVAAMDQVLDNLSGDFNVGVMRFGGFDGGRVIYPITDLTMPGVKEEIKAVIHDIETVTGTPTVGALEEAWRYFTGRAVVHGKDRAITDEDRSKRSSRVSHPDSYTGGMVIDRGACGDDLNSEACKFEKIVGDAVYQSPILSECQSNHAILLTDGAAWLGPNGTNVPDYQPTIDTIVNLSRDAGEVDAVSAVNVLPSDASDGHCKTVYGPGLCGEELARYIGKYDLLPMSNTQTITTHAIGFNVENNWLNDVAVAGGGRYLEAASSLDLIEAIDEITTEASDAPASLVAPSATIDQFTRLSHREEVYLALFKPEISTRWAGNLKKYKFSGANPTLKDQNGDDAIDAATGEFLTESESFWSDSADGSDILLGGVASQLNTTARADKMVSFLDSDNANLTAAGNKITLTNTAITAAMLGVPNSERNNVINWLTGIDVNDEDGDGSTIDARNHIGDPLHSDPVVVTYGVEVGEELDEDNPNSLVFFGTNEGFLHAIDTETGAEEFAFMPSELLSNVGLLYANERMNNVSSKPYGMDGNLTLQTLDNNNNGMIEADESDTAYLYAGMRRGGRNYYALDVSEKSEPEFLWSVIGGAGDFAELGQTWSKPIATRVKIGSTVRDVLVFAGGYDPRQDNNDTRTPDTQGRAIYFVDAETGELVWSGSHPQHHPQNSTKHFSFDAMEYSMPADLALLADPDTGYLQQIYAGDMGGRLWRFDIQNGNGIADLVDGGIIADFADESEAGARRFYGAPDISLSKEDGDLMVNIAIGSGYRAHPLDLSIEDKFFVYRYPHDGYPNNYVSASLSDLYDATDNLIADGSDAAEISEAVADLSEKDGWFITMEGAGEKILDRSSTFQGVVRFISYVPSAATDVCQPSLGSSYFYAVNLLDGTAFEDLNEDAVNPRSKDFRKQAIATPGIAPPVSTIFVKNGSDITPIDVSGTNKLHDWGDVAEPKRWFWAETPDF